jgi:cytochrome oxidase Cu insertion factor (SCO1/SenC/PrrC family)
MNETGAVPQTHADDRGNAQPGAQDPQTPESPQSPQAQQAPQSPRARTRRSTIMLAVIAALSGVAFATVFAFAVTRLGARDGNLPFRPTGIPASVSTKLAGLMQLSPVPEAAAPGFTLTDQSGRPVSLASLRGRTVVLTFMDSHCTDICPLVSREFINARKDLGSAARNVVFIAVNVNQYHRRIADVASYSGAEGLDSIGSWHFVTGPLRDLRTVWNNYQIMVHAPSRDADVIHTSLIYFIDPHGRERYVAAPMVDHTAKGVSYLPPGQLKAWGRGIALVARAISG